MRYDANNKNIRIFKKTCCNCCTKHNAYIKNSKICFRISNTMTINYRDVVPRGYAAHLLYSQTAADRRLNVDGLLFFIFFRHSSWHTPKALVNIRYVGNN